MARPTLKVTKPVDPAAAPKALTSRAWRAQQANKPHKAASAAPATPAPSAAPAPTPVASPAAGTRRRKRPASGGKRAEAPSPGARRATPSGGTSDRTKRDFAPGKKRTSGSHATPTPGASAAPATGVRQRRSSHPKPVSPMRSPPSAPAPARPPRHDNPDDPRLSKRMSELGLCSRREADEWIENGWVTVDGKVVDTLGTRVSPHARIEVDPAASKHQSELVTILLNKPIGYVSGQAEDGYQPAMVLIRPENRWAADPSQTTFKPGHLRGLAPAGRLDIDSTGLLVFTQDGRIAKLLIGRDSAIEKEYLVRVEGKLSGEGMKLLQHGLELDGVKLKPARVSWQNEDQLRIVLREGRKRQIRRMCELVGLTVTGLKRVRSGSVPLGALPVGQWRYLRRDEKF
jgi:23S rRNA pseudouridine2604 synthase